ncbi:MAG: stealth family protein [Ignavibacteriae bacterium]|nr:stealth family protein [Ignavibacteriota bacterium]MCB9206849.1 stealth family protein [Ignavibacteriales bacterium]MCB9210142.1 stealth family protein [Ignavibacteriales bacterium]MCB9218473.1 stealth family protein [Ignavibacteriales bacterium]MCB9259521.1 stealth family protein [Ignavibacteriales bacterium]
MKIDVVYTWVDGSDPVWENKRRLKADEIGKVLKESINQALFSNNEELKYSLRSIDKFAPWINKVFIVTDNQIPKWLKIENKKLQIIDHTEIFKNSSHLPTFNASAIETNLHHINDLSENFIYFNDDMFLGNICHPHFFYTSKGIPFIYTSEILPLPNKKAYNIKKRKKSKINYYQNAIVETRKLLKNKLGLSTFINIRHSIKPLKKSLLYKLEELFKAEFNKTSNSNFRIDGDILPIHLFAFYSSVKKLGKLKYLITNDVKAKKFDLFSKFYKKFTFGFINLHESDIEDHLDRILNAKPFTFCLNQTPETPPENLIKVKNFLEKYFPEKSQFEK